MPKKYVVLGAGRQGTAAAYDLARWGDTGSVVVADYNLAAARQAAERVNNLIGKAIAEPTQVDVQDAQSLRHVLTEVDACLSAVPYIHNFEITRVAVEAKTNMCDLGGHIGIARQQHSLDADARAAGISIIPNCGQVPGLGTTLMVYTMSLLDEPIDVYMWDGGIQRNRDRPSTGASHVFGRVRCSDRR